MKARKLIIVMSLFLISAMAMGVFAEEGRKIEGIYSEVMDKNFIFNGKEVEIIEFLSFYCGHCFQFEKSIPVIKGNFPKKIKWTVLPIFWGKGSPKPGEAYMLAQEAGKGEEMKKALFEAFFIQRKDIGAFEVLEEIGVSIGLGFDFSRKLRSREKAFAAQKALEKAGKYNVNETPTLIIAGNLRVSPGLLDNDMKKMGDNTVTILKSILKK